MATRRIVRLISLEHGNRGAAAQLERKGSVTQRGAPLGLVPPTVHEEGEVPEYFRLWQDLLEMHRGLSSDSPDRGKRLRGEASAINRWSSALRASGLLRRVSGAGSTVAQKKKTA